MQVQKCGTKVFDQVHFDDARIELRGNGMLNATDVTYIDRCTMDGVLTDGTEPPAGDPVFASITSWRSLYLDDVNMSRITTNAEYQVLNVGVLNVKDSELYKSFFNVHGRTYKMKNSNFQVGAVGSYGLTLYATIENCTFDQSDVFDESDVMLLLKESSFDDTSVAKHNGELRLRCSDFNNRETGVYGGPFCTVNLSANQGGGYNVFDEVDTPIEVWKASGIWLDNGNNQFNAGSATADPLIYGSLIGDCDCPPQTLSSNTNQILDATGNFWNFANGDTWQDVDLQLHYFDNDCIDDPCFPEDHWYNCQHCPIVIQDRGPLTALTQCGTNDGVVKPTKVREISEQENALSDFVVNARLRNDYVTRSSDSNEVNNPLIYTTYFQGDSLSDALGIATSNLTNLSDSGDDLIALNMFHDILTYSELDLLNAEIRWKCFWGFVK